MSDSSRGRRGPYGAVLACALCAACSSDPEVVAKPKTDSLLPGESHSKCQEGAYQGLFFTDPESVLKLSGPMEFSLVPSGRGEFLELGPSTKLEGRDSSGTSKFSADVATEVCVAGNFTTELDNGHFAVLDAEGNPNPNLDFPFTGTIEGEYIESGRVFYGVWTTTSPVLKVTGRWVASWYSNADGGL